MLPKDNKVPANTYYAKKLISPLTMGVEKIHACRNHCILYRGDDYRALDSCPKCGASRYKTNKDYIEEECVASVPKGKNERRPNKRPRRVVQNPPAKKRKK
jgi:predicted  nucleic acid-binding Zn-ribbon protein